MKGKEEVAHQHLALGRCFQHICSMVFWDSRLTPAFSFPLKDLESRGRPVDVETSNSDSWALCETRSKQH